MNKKLTIAIAAILTFTLILSGCAVLPQSAEATLDDQRPYADVAIREEERFKGKKIIRMGVSDLIKKAKPLVKKIKKTFE